VTATRNENRQSSELRSRLLDWYEQNHRQLPWRQSRSPYAIWVSEIMLQQTRVAVVIDRFTAFLSRFPSIVSLAQADEEAILALWSGLGYYRRARMLHKAAQLVTAQNQGNLPEKAADLRKLPGIGDYTAAAIASIAHGEPVAVVDGNVERVICRLAGWSVEKSRTAAFKRQITSEAQRLLDTRHPGEFNQAMMELGATVCTPRNPLCKSCPIAAGCATQGEHHIAPRPKMTSREVGFALSVRTSPTLKGHSKGQEHGWREVLLEQRPATESVMPSMWQLPPLLSPEVPESDLRMSVRHAIMQVNYYVRIRTVFEDDIPELTTPSLQRRWVRLEDAATMALTGLARKVLSRAKLLPAPALDGLAEQMTLARTANGKRLQNPSRPRRRISATPDA
jgi:A/G-specific adenine glycosylase